MDRNQSPMEVAGADAAAEDFAERFAERTGLRVNVAKPERWISAAAGGGLLYYGISKRSWPGALMALAGANLVFRGVMGTSILYRFLGINTAEKLADAKRAASSGEFKAEKSIAIDRSPEEVYRFWRNFENLPRVMKHLKSVRSIDEKRSHWVAKAPAGIEIEWDAEITDDRENRKISWRSIEGSGIKNNGVVLFEPLTGDRTTELRVYLEYSLPAGKAGKAFGKIFGKDPDKILDEDLRRFKSLMETGEAAFGQMARR